jgi:replicative DNA helicase
LSKVNKYRSLTRYFPNSFINFVIQNNAKSRNCKIMAEKKNIKVKSTVEQVNELYGKMPPQAIDIEEVLLGALMLERDAVLLVIDILTADSFYKEEHQSIFTAILDLAKEQQPVDILTVTNKLRAEKQLDEIGGAHYITSLTSRVATAAHVEFHAKIVQQKFIQRELIRAASDIQNKAFNEAEDVDNLLNFAEHEIFKIAEGSLKKESVRVNSLVEGAMKLIEEASEREDGLSGVPSGFSELDRMTSGWQPSDLMIIAARPAMGKTAFVLSMARNMAVDHKQAVAVFSLEMSSLQLVTRLISSETELSGTKLRNGDLHGHEWEQLESKVRPLEEAPIYIDDTPAISIFELRAKARRLVQSSDVKVIIIDYLQLMTAGVDSKGSREFEVSLISRSLKAIAKELNVPIIALSQLNRSVETRGGDKRPQLSDLRESGAIEQDADMVMFIHRAEYYGVLEDENGLSMQGKAEIILAKHRNGATGNVMLDFRADYAKFLDPIPDLDPSGMTMPSKLNGSGSDSTFQMPTNDDFGGNMAAEDDDSPFG